MTQVASVPELAHDRQAVKMALIFDVAIITTLWCVSSVIVNPVGNFPLNDDWAYGLMVKHLLETGDYRPLQWALAPSVTNVLWGALFCVPAGFSFTALRLSTLFASLLGLIASYVLVRDLCQPRWIAVLVALTLGFNGIYFALSHTFMTDASFTAMAIGAAVFLARSLKTDSNSQMMIGAAFAVAATLSRQLALCIPLAFAVVLFLKPGLSLRTAWRASFPLISCVGGFLAFREWLVSSGRMLTFNDEKTAQMLQALTDIGPLLELSFRNFFVYALYLGLFLLPILLLSSGDLFRARHPFKTIALVLGLSTVAGGVAHRLSRGEPILLPFMHNVLAKSGIGPLTLRDTFVLKLEHVPPLPAAFWIVVTALGLCGAVLLVAKIGLHAFQAIPRLRKRSVADTELVGAFLMLCGIIYLLPLLVTPKPLDRYLIPLVALFAAGMVAVSTRSAKLDFDAARPLRFSAIAMLMALGAFAIGTTRDYLAWNRLRWVALEDLQRDGQVDAEEIDGGFEFNGLYLYDPNTNVYASKTDRSWWWVHRDTYQLGFGAVPGYVVTKEYNYHNWLPSHPQKVVVLRKME